MTYPTRPKMGTRNTIASQNRPFMPRILASWYTQSAMSRNARYSPMRNNVNVVSDVAPWNGIAMTDKATVALLTPTPLPMKSVGRMPRGIFIGCRARPSRRGTFYSVTRRSSFGEGRVGGTHDGGAAPRGRRRVHAPWAPRLPVPLHRRPAPGCRAHLGRGRGRRDEEAACLRLPGVLSLSDASAGNAHQAGGEGAGRRARDSGTAADPRGCEILHELWSRSGARPLVLSKLRSAYRDVAYDPHNAFIPGNSSPARDLGQELRRIWILQEEPGGSMADHPVVRRSDGRRNRNDPEHGRPEVRPSGPNDRERRGRDADSSRHRRELPYQRARLPRPDGHRGTKRRRSGLERGADGPGARGLHDERVGPHHDRPDSARRRAGPARRAHDDPRAPRRNPLDRERERPHARQSRRRRERRRGPGRGLETGPHGRDPPDRGLSRRDGGERGEHDGGSRGATHRGMDGRPRLPAGHLEPRGAASGPR